MSNYYTTGGAAFMSDRMEWRTPLSLFAELDAEFHFTLDAAASEANRLCEDYFSIERSAFQNPWSGRVFINPPYGRDARRWIARISEQAPNCEVVAALLPARTDTFAFHHYLYNKPNVELRFLRGRLRFGHPDTGAPCDPAPFPSMIAVLRP